MRVLGCPAGRVALSLFSIGVHGGPRRDTRCVGRAVEGGSTALGSSRHCMIASVVNVIVIIIIFFHKR